MSRTALLTLLAMAGCGRLGFDEASTQYEFLDEGQLLFDLGTYDVGSTPLVWQAGRVQFAAVPPFARTDIGIYVSRVFDTQDPNARWDTLAWLSPGPQGRALPDDGAIDEGFAEGALAMADNLLLLHFDGANAASDGDPVPDRSGQLHDGTLVLADQAATYVPGAFGNALDLARDAWVRLDGQAFDYGTGDFTYAVWVKMFACSESNDNRIALGGAGAGDTPHAWIGARCPDTCPGGDGAFMNWLDSTRMGTALDVCTGVVLDDGAWHQLAGVKAGHANARLSLYVDGREVGTTTHDYTGATFTYDGGELRLGSFNLNDPQYNTRIVVDEAAIWTRALTAAEIEASYRRGALHLELQFRACPDGTCDSEPFVGPDGTPATYFTDGAPGMQRENLASLGLTGRLGQYRARFSTALATVSPALVRVTVTAARP